MSLKVKIPAQRTGQWINPLKGIRLKRVAGDGHCAMLILGDSTGRRRGRPYAESIMSRQMIFVGPGSVPACSDGVATKPSAGTLARWTGSVLAIKLLLMVFFWTITALWAAVSAGDPADQWNGEPVIISEIHIQLADQDRRNRRFDWKGLAEDIISLKSGDTLTREKLDQVEKVLTSFADVKTTIQPRKRGVSVSLWLQLHQRIKTLSIRGAYPLFEREVRNLMTIAPGDIFRSQTVLDQADLIKQRYQAEGYIDPVVDISWEQTGDHGHYDINIDIEKGRAYTLRHIQLTGNRAFSDTLLKGLMASWRASAVQLGTGRWVASRIKSDIQKLQTFYRSQGYADARIEYAVVNDPGQATAALQVQIEEGARYVIEFEGNRFFSDAALKRNLVIFDSGNRGNIGLRRSIQNIRRRYLQAGFADVRIRQQSGPPQDGPSHPRRVRIEIQEGARYIVDRVILNGNRALAAEAIRAQMLTRPPHGLDDGAYVAHVLQEDVAAVSALYHQQGYLQANIVETIDIASKMHQVTVSLNIDEGLQTRVGRIRIETDRPLADDRLKTSLPFKTGAIYQPRAVIEGENELAARIASQGYPHVKVNSRIDMSEDGMRADIVYSIDPGPLVEVGRIFWTGNFRTRDSVLRREIDLKPGEPFALTRVLDAQRKLRDLNLFQSVQVRSIGLKEKASRVHLMVTLVEKPAYYLEMGAGYQTDKGAYGRIKIGDRNILGRNKEIRLGGEISGIGYRWDGGVVEPRLLGSIIRADAGLFTERKEEFNQVFGLDTTGAKFTLSRPWGKRYTTALGVRYERRRQYLRDSGASADDVDPEALNERAIWVTTPAIRYDSRDSFIRPRQGIFAGLAADISKGLDNSLDDFVKYKLDVRAYYTPYQRLTLAGRTFMGYVQPYGAQNDIPEDQLFFLGGANDVRGFDENLLRFDQNQDPVGGRLAMMGSIEARYELGRNWELALFVDTGSVQQPLSGSDQEDDQWQWSGGLGLRYITPIGPIGLLYGYKLAPRPNESNGQLHFSIGYTF